MSSMKGPANSAPRQPCGMAQESLDFMAASCGGIEPTGDGAGRGVYRCCMLEAVTVFRFEARQNLKSFERY